MEQRLDGLGLERVELLVLGRLERGEISRRARPVPKLGAKLPPHPPKLGVLRRVVQGLFSHSQGLSGAAQASQRQDPQAQAPQARRRQGVRGVEGPNHALKVTLGPQAPRPGDVGLGVGRVEALGVVTQGQGQGQLTPVEVVLSAEAHGLGGVAVAHHSGLQGRVTASRSASFGSSGNSA